ncbi:MAG: CerR family C-terminal domain-containing protein [Gemmatimonadaceae bacterium]
MSDRASSRRPRAQQRGQPLRRSAPDDVTGKDTATRQRLLNAGRQLFVTRGFKKVTVREITDAAGANIAAVSYHFRDKLGLYLEVVHEAIAAAEQLFATQRAPSQAPADERLRHYVHASLQRMADIGETKAWIQQIIGHEMMDPTPALPLIIERVTRPRLNYLADIVSELLQCQRSDPKVGFCVASIHAQFIFHLRSQMRDIAFAEWKLGERSPTEVADHIVAFTLSGIQAADSRKRRKSAER